MVLDLWKLTKRVWIRHEQSKQWQKVDTLFQVYSQLRMSEMKTANPRIPSPLTAGIFVPDTLMLNHIYEHDSIYAKNYKQHLEKA